MSSQQPSNESSQSPFLRSFLGTERWKALSQALVAQTRQPLCPPLSLTIVIYGLLLALIPTSLAFLRHTMNSEFDITTVGFGTCTVLAILFRRRIGLTPYSDLSLKESFSLTHTAFALGCIPAVLVLLWEPNLFVARSDLLRSSFGPEPEFMLGKWELLFRLLLVFAGSALWVAVTEEYLFRGLLLVCLRRWKPLVGSRLRDPLAIALSALVFGAAHYPTWGLGGAIALSGLGLGFSIGFIANGERLGPLILYHFLFDFLSMLLGLFVLR